MRAIDTQWDIGDTVTLRRDDGSPVGNQQELISYYNVAIAGSGRIDLRTGRLNDRRHAR